jgi:hypothetical protein
VDDVRFLAPFKFYRQQPRSLLLNARLIPDGDELVAHCRLVGVREIKTQSTPQTTVHFTAVVRLGREGPPAEQGIQPPPSGTDTIARDHVYKAYFHGPAYQVLDGAWGDGPDVLVGKMSDDLPANHTPADKPLLLAPRHIELCFQTAGMYELALKDRFGLPAKIGRVIKYREPAEETKPLYTVVRHHGAGPGFDADVVDEAGTLYLRLEDYRTAALPGGAADEVVAPIRSALRRAQ